MAKSTCAACNTVFSGLSGFDKHQTVDKNRPKWKVNCHPPEKVGLVSKDGVWGFPAPDKTPSHYVQPVRTVPKVYDCSCGRKFRSTGRRGRPPRTCTECGGKGVLV